MRLMLDTNAYTGYLRSEPAVTDRVDSAARILLPAAVVGELIYGFRHGTRYRKNLDQLERFLAKPFVAFVPVTFETCSRFGSVAAELRRAGTPIPVNDVWVAAHALQTGASLLTYDAHFERVAGLSMVYLGGLRGCQSAVARRLLPDFLDHEPTSCHDLTFEPAVKPRPWSLPGTFAASR